jgi:hypothetical protein
MNNVANEGGLNGPAPIVLLITIHAYVSAQPGTKSADSPHVDRTQQLKQRPGTGDPDASSAVATMSTPALPSEKLERNETDATRFTICEMMTVHNLKHNHRKL